MGEVYRATGTKLKRDVAIKVLPDEVSQDPDRLGRFQREGKLFGARRPRTSSRPWRRGRSWPRARVTRNGRMREPPGCFSTFERWTSPARVLPGTEGAGLWWP